MKFNVIAFVVLVNALNNGGFALTSLVQDIPPAKEEVQVRKSCTYDRVYRMKGCDCSKMDLKEVPSILATNIEMLEISYNRIRELTKQSFARYPNIRLLYMYENMIRTVEEGAFAHLTNLEAIDLSTNALTTIPMELLQLPLLRNLHINDNHLVQISNDLLKLAKPIKAPLQVLNFGSCRLDMVPDLGILPQLVVMNISNNPLDEVTAQQFSPFCSLISIEIQNATQMPPCMCKTIKIYFRNRSITMKEGLDCSTEREDEVYCADTANSTFESPLYGECMIEVENRKLIEKTKRTWVTIVIGLAAFFGIFIGILYYFHRRNVQQKKVEIIMTKLKHPSERGTVEVLLNEKT